MNETREPSAGEQRGLTIAATLKLANEQDGWWTVPSQTGNGKKYVVCLERKTPFCSCPDHEATGKDCKHIYAVRYVLERELDENGNVTVTETLTVTKRKTYKQDWPNYDLAQTTEGDRLQGLLYDLCSRLPQHIGKRGRGRPKTPIADAVFSACLKVYSTLSTRRAMCDLKHACEQGYVSRMVHFTSVAGFLENKELTPVLRGLIAQSSLPLKAIESKFSVDSTGFGTLRFSRWYEEKYGEMKTQRDWIKCHICTGTKTNIVTAVEVTDQHANDCPFFPGLVKATAKNFRIDEASADKGYLSGENIDTVFELGGMPYIEFKDNSTGGIGGLFEKMFHYYSLNKDEFMDHYHLRSNVESTFSAIKRKFGDFVRSKTDTAMRNEVLAKVLCHNLSCVIHSQCELGIEPVFWPEEKGGGKAVILPMMVPPR